MATQEKLLKSLETLQNLMLSNTTSDLTRKKEKIQHCNFITEAMSNSTIKIAPNFSSLLNFSIETFLKLVDDPESDIRMIADECLNRIIKAMSNGNIGKVQIELHKEIKKNGAARSLRAALSRFSQLAHLIRPHKGKPYVTNLIPCIIKITEREEEMIQETLANSLPNIMNSLGSFTTDNDIKNLLNAFLNNVKNKSAVIRRTSAACILTICLHCRKPYVFATYVLNNLLDQLVPLQENQPSTLVLGIFGCIKVILPHMKNNDNGQEIQGSFGLKKQANEVHSAQDKLLQVYELCLHYILNGDHNIVNAALETLNILLQNAPQELKIMLLSPNGLVKSRLLVGSANLSFKQHSCSQLSIATTVIVDEQVSVESDLTDSLKPDIEKWIDESKLSVINVTYAKTNEQKQHTQDVTDAGVSNFDGIETPNYSNITIGPLSDTYTEHSGTKSLSDNLETLALSENSSEKSCTQLAEEKSNFSTLDEDIYEEVNVGEFTDKAVSLFYAARIIAKSFLLTGIQNTIKSEKNVRVSVKNLALSCLSTIFRIYPNAFLMYLDKNCVKNSAKSKCKQCISDILLYDNHSDPQLRGAVRILVASFVKSVLLISEGEYDNWIAENSMVTESEVFNLTVLLLNIIQGIEDESSNCTRQSLVGLHICLPYILDYKYYHLLNEIFKLIPLLSKNPYWLVKVKLLEVVSEIEYISTYHITGTSEFQNNVLYNILFELLKDEDQRVRNACSSAIIRIIPYLYFQQDNFKQNEIMSKAILCKNELLSMLDEIQMETSISKRTFIDNMPFPFNNIDNLDNNFNLEKSLSRIISQLHKYLLTSTSKYFMFGCVETLTMLSSQYPPTVYLKSWGCFKNFTVSHEKNIFQRSLSSSNQISVIQEHTINNSADLLNVCVDLLLYSTFGYDFNFHLNLLKFTGNLYSAKCFQNLKPVSNLNLENSKELWDMFSDKNLCQLSELFLNHIVKLLNIFSHVLDEVVPVLPQSKPSLPNLPSATNLSPLKRRKSDMGDKTKIISPLKTPEKDDKGEKRDAKFNCMGHFASIPHYMKIYELLKIAYNNYKITLDLSASENFLGFLKTTLSTLSQILEIATLTEISRVAEEILHYLRSTFILEPSSSVECVQQLLKSLFGSNLTSNISEILLFLNKHNKEEAFEDVPSFYINIFQKPYNKVADCIKSLHNVNKIECDGDSTVMGYLHRRETKKITLTKGSDKILASYIPIFEPMVIKSLKQYTITSDVKLQSRVLQLLSQLVQLRINYCLLDSEEIFIGFVLKQFEFIEEGQIQYADELIPKIFQFLVYLSYDKQHSKSIISVPKLIQLCDGLMASGQSPITHCIPALKPLVEDIFLMRNKSNTQDFKELETTREVLISMLLRLLEYHEVIELLCVILNESKYCDNSEKWYRWSKQIVDALLPKLRQNKIRLENVENFNSLKKLIFMLNFEAFRPINQVLITAFQDPPSLNDPLSTINRWLGKIIIMFLILSQSKEDVFLSKIMETKLNFGSKIIHKNIIVNTDPLNVTKTFDYFEGLSPELIFNRFLFRIIEICVEKLLNIYQNEESTFIVKEFGVFLMFCLYIFQSGSHCKTACTAMNLINNEKELTNNEISLAKINKMFLRISKCYPILTLEWCYLLTLLNYSNADFWISVMSAETVNGVNCLREATMNTEITKLGTIIVYCDFLVENLPNNQLEWFLTHNMEFIVKLCNEAPVFELLAAVNRNQNFSFLMMKIIYTKCVKSTDAVFRINVLKTVENIHSSQVGALLKMLIYNLLDSKELAVSRLVANLASRKIEYLLTLSMEEVNNQLSKDDLVHVVDHLIKLKLAKKHETLTSLLNKLSTQFYDLSPVEFDQKRSINPEYIKKLHINKNWYLSLIKTKCETGCRGQDIAELLNSLDYDDLITIMHSKGFNQVLLKDCILFSRNDMQKRGLEEESPLLKASINCVLESVLHFRSLNPEDHQVFFVKGRESTFQENKYTLQILTLFEDNTFSSFLIKIHPIVSLYLNSLPISPNLTIPDDNLADITHLGMVCLEYVNYMFTVNHNIDINFLDVALNCADCILKESRLVNILSTDSHISWLCSYVNSVYFIVDSILLKDKPLPVVPKNCLKGTLNNCRTAPAGHACHQLTVLISWLQTVQDVENVMPRFIFNFIKSITISLSRLPFVNSFVLTPPSFWKLGDEIEFFGPFLTQVPPIPIKYLQEVEILEEFIYRITLLGWTSRQQYEETWMCLLSVLSATPDECNDPQDVNTFTHTTSLAVQTITSLLVQTLYIPEPGNKNISKLLQVSRNTCIQEKSASIKKLKIVHNILQNKFREYNNKCLSSNENLMNIFDNTNLEKESKEYSYGQLSLEYLLVSAKIVNVQENLTKAAQLSLQRETMLQDNGLDINSCLQFLLDLYSQWIRDIPVRIRLLHEVVKSILIISDLFTEKTQFSWMLESCLELSKTHIVEDEIIHQYLVIAVCKAASVLTPDMETYLTIQRIVTQTLKSSFLPSRIASLHGILYIMQGCVLGNTVIGGLSEEMQLFVPIAIQYIKCNISAKSSLLNQSQEHHLLLWSLSFYLIENVDENHLDVDFTSFIIQEAIRVLSSDTITHWLHNSILKGLERLVITQSLSEKQREQVMKLSLEKMKNKNSIIALPALQLLLTCMYTECADQLNETEKSNGIVQSNPDNLVQTIEKVSAIFDRIKKGYPMEVDILCTVLPIILNDFFPPSDILTKVIGEFLAPQQRHAKALSRVVFQVFKRGIEQNQLNLLQDWVVFSLSNFTQSLPIGMATWCLTCFFISASTNPWLRSLFPYIQSRIGRYEYEDRKLLCIASSDFYRNLTNEKQKNTFVETFNKVKHQVDTPFCDLLSSL